MMQSLTRVQAEALAFMVAFQEKHGHAPSFREMADGLGLKSTSGVHRQVRALEERGVLVRRIAKYGQARQARAYEFVPIPTLPKADIFLQLLLDRIEQEGVITEGDALVKRISKAIAKGAAQ